jgi:hypothetical protein
VNSSEVRKVKSYQQLMSELPCELRTFILLIFFNFYVSMCVYVCIPSVTMGGFYDKGAIAVIIQSLLLAFQVFIFFSIISPLTIGRVGWLVG